MRINVNQTMNRLLLALALIGAALLAGCSTTKAGGGNATYDFGAAEPGPAAATPFGALVVTDATGSPALDSERMYYRLNYADPLQARTYAGSRWTSTPLNMVTQRFKSRLAQSGAKVLSVTDASAGVPILRVEVDDFTHTFDSATQSYGQLVLRASLFSGHKLVDQKTFKRRTGAASADAAGGARALADSTDAAAADLIAWLATLPQPNQPKQ
jgi:cholesterol transport system auxiliary component